MWPPECPPANQFDLVILVKTQGDPNLNPSEDSLRQTC